MTRVIFLISSLLVFMDGVQGEGENTDSFIYGNNFGVRESPVFLFEMEGAKQGNKFTRGGLYQATIKKFSVSGTNVTSPLKMGLYITDVNAMLEYSVSAIDLQTRRRGVCSGTNFFSVKGKLYGNFFAMEVKTKQLLFGRKCDSYLLIVEAKIDKRTVDKAHVLILAGMSGNFEPRFNETKISKTIPYNFPLFQPIMQLKTKDTNDWGKVYFSLQKESKYFVLNPVNGMLFLRKSLPLMVNRYKLVAAVTKWDDSKPGQQSFTDKSCKVIIKVENVNQYSPRIHVKVLNKEQSKGNKSVIAVITVSDFDQGKNGQIDNLKITLGNEEGNFGLERVDPNMTIFKMFVVKPIDCDYCWFRVSLTATDSGSPPLSSTKLHHFSLKNSLSRKHSLIEDNNYVEISEMMPINYTMIDLHPQNLGTTSNISCTIVQGDNSNTLKIPKNTCKIKIDRPLDALVRSSYDLGLSYTISGGISISGSTNVHVKIVDFNNHVPVFVSKSHYVEVFEGMPLHASVYKIEVKDGDVDDNGKLTYWLMNDSSYFKIDPNTGVISVKRVLDRDAGIPEYAYLIVRVADNGSPFRREIETVVTIRTKARNDNPPVIKQDICQIKLSHDLSVGTKLVQIKAVDVDVDSDTKISYSLTSGNMDGFFKIDASSGSVTVAKPLSLGTSFSLVISARDGTQKSHNSANLQIWIAREQNASGKNISCSTSSSYDRALKFKQHKFVASPVKPVVSIKTPRNMYTPKFTNKAITIAVSEDVKVGSVLATLKAVDNDNGYEGLLTYYIVDGKQNLCFSINALTGELKVVASLNKGHDGKYELNVSAWDSGTTRKVGFVKVIIVVDNVSNNLPKFLDNFYNISVPENSPPGTMILKLISIHAKVDKKFTFQLVNDYNKLFSVDDGGSLTVNKALDFEEQDRYEVQVLAVGGLFDNQPSPHADVVVNVEDMNDNYPIVHQSNQHAVIMRDIPVGSPITQVLAYDADSGDDGELQFFMIESPGSVFFSIDTATGFIKLSKILTGNTQQSYNLTITVSDGGQPSLSVNTFVNILVIQRVGHPVESGITQYVVTENLPAGQIIGELAGSEIPMAKRSIFAFSIIDGTDVTMFNITDGWLRTAALLDREVVTYYWLTIQVVNKQSKQPHSNMQVLIKVTDENDNRPVFYPPVYESKIPENTKAGELVVTLSATDPDSGDNGKLTFTIIKGNEDGHFTIDATTGVITTSDIQLDYERKAMYRLVVSVTDGGNQPKTNEATITIYVQDENDNSPEFQPEGTFQYSMSGRDTVPPNTFLGQILAHDKDSGQNGALTFRILSGNIDGKLRIDVKSGQLYNEVPVGELDAFKLEIEAKDGGKPALSSTHSVQVFLMQRSPVHYGKLPPKFIQKEVEISLAENTLIGHKVKITPAAKNRNSLTYFIYSGNEERKFRINGKGETLGLEIIAELEPPSYQLVIGASDGFYSGNCTLNIKIADENNHYPVPEMTEKIASIPENAEQGTKVTIVSASDLDFGDNAKLRYSFKSAIHSSSLDLFSMDGNTGEISVSGQLDYEKAKRHILIVGVKDSSSSPKESTMYVVVNVEDVNEWKPVFVQSSYDVYVQENTPRGSDVIKVVARDKDQGLDGVLKYSITSGNHGFAFFIKPESGVIQTNKLLAASDISKYVLTVEARDDGSYGLTSTTNVTIHLLRNGYRYGFAKSSFSASVYENEPVNTYVASVNFNGWMTAYTILKDLECADDFLINPFTGVITTQKILDAEKYVSCSLRIKAQDGSGFSQEILLNVQIKNVNDNRPVVEPVFTGYIEENSALNSQILTSEGRPLVISARDVDVNSRLKYEIINPAVRRLFKIGQDRGDIRSNKVTLDYETQQTYRFLVKVSDQGSPLLSTITTVLIHVKNINDVQPEFPSKTIEVRVYLPVYQDLHITTLTASDPDQMGSLAFTITQQDTPSLLNVDVSSGNVFIDNPSKVQKGWYNAVVQVSDGKLTSDAKLSVVFKDITSTTLQFSELFLQTHARENISEVQTVYTPIVRGYKVWERLRFSLNTFEDIFTIKESTGVVKTKPGVVLDREQTDSYLLVVTVEDERTPPRAARCLVTVVVDDINDCTPTFPSPPIFYVVSKSAKTGSTVATITASDCDIGKNSEVRYEIKKDDSGMFGIDPSSGALNILSQLVGLITPVEFSLTIEAKDLGDNYLESKADVSVRIESGDACIFEKPSYSLKLPEDTVPDKVFKQLHARCPNGKPVFSIVLGDNYSNFECDVNTGELSLLSELDFEDTGSYMLSVRAQDSKTGASSLATVRVDVQDINDNAPVFIGSPYSVKVKESAPAGSSLLRVYTLDRDFGDNRRHSYEIVGDTSGIFSINEDTGILRIEKQLDYEAQIQYAVVVRATDHGIPSLSAETGVTVLVKDVNDHAPEFQKSQYHATVLENGGPSHFITQVVAKDADENDFSKLKYSIVPGVGTSYFEIDEKSGVVSLSEVPGIALGKVYFLKLSVFDGNHTAYTKLDVVVGQSNNHPPKFQKDIYNARVTENYPADSYVAMVTATDQDSGKFGEVVYAIDSLALTKDFKIDSNTGIITTERSLDREIMSSITIPVRARDRGGETTICNVQVKILDENDNQPRFLMPSYTAVISLSNTSIGESVIRVTAVDPDDGDNGALTYSLVGLRSPYVFGIDASSGVITFLRKPMESVYNFYVRANDNGYLKLKSYTPVRVYIDNLLFKFEYPHYSFTFSETVHGAVPARFALINDQGIPVTSNVDYSIEVGNSMRTNKLGTFSVDSTGRLQVSLSLDYETVQSYDLIIKANRSSFFAYVMVHIDIIDANDNKPEFESDLYIVNVPEDAGKGRKMVQVRAHDKDSKENGLVSYKLSSESKVLFNVFTVDPSTGWLSVAGRLDRETISSYVVKIDAKDHGRNTSLMSTTSVKIIVDDVNDSPPAFSQQIYRVSIREDLPVYSAVLTLNTTDRDLNSNVVYYIVHGDRKNKFDIDQTSGKIFLSSNIDREIFPRYLLNITAFDGAFTATAFVEIEIMDVNDNKPVCHDSSLQLTVSEDLAVGSPIVTVNASDSDADNNSRIVFQTYSHLDVFTVDRGTGTVKLKHTLDREKKASYNILVSASDGDSSCFTNMTIDILDTNDNPPQFTKSRYVKLIAVDAEENAFLLRVEATDKDLGVNRKVSYGFVNSSTTDLFTIEKETGVILLKSRLLHRDEEKFVFNVIATDGGVPPLLSIASVEIVVSTIENCPFVKDPYKSDISESVKSQHEIDTVAVTCSGKDISIIYKIASKLHKIHRLFEIDGKTGKLTLKSALDYETTRAHIFTVEALMVKPSGKTILISSASVKIKVLDYNDNKPVFSRQLYEATVNEGSAFGTIVIPLSASDNDTSSKIIFAINASNSVDLPFAIDSLNGIVTVQGELDHEKVSKYEFLVHVQDDGNPPLSSQARLVVNIKDLNDNPPVVEKEMKTLVHTNTPTGSVILQLNPTDRDGPKNSKPFTFSIISGGNSDIKLNSSSGALFVQKPLTRYNKTYVMTLQTVDSGSPALCAQTRVEITIVKPTFNPPDVQPITVYVNILINQFSGGIIGQIIPKNQAKDTILRFALMKGNPVFSIGSKDGAIKMLSILDPGSYPLHVQVTDGTYEIETQVTVRVKEITPDAVNNSVIVRISGKTLDSFVSTSLSALIHTLADILSCNVENVYLWSIQTALTNKLDIVFAVKKQGEKEFFSPNILRETLEDQLDNFQKSSKVVVSSVGLFPCDKRRCLYGKKCRNKINVLNEWSSLTGDKTIFLSYKNKQISECFCPEGVSEAECEVSTSACLKNLCKPGFECKPLHPTGYQCVCPRGKDCSEECYGNKCSHTNAMTFNGNSYIRYSLRDEKAKISSFSVSLRTTKRSGTIFSVKGPHDYFILEIVDGKIRARFEYGSGEGVGTIDQVRVNDGKWHKVVMNRKERNVRLTLDSGKYMAESVASGSMSFLNVDKKNIIVGGEAPKRSKRSISNGYFGCMENPRLNGKDLALSGSKSPAKAEVKGVTNNCSINICHSSFCRNGGVCKMKNDAPTCQCKAGFISDNCGEDVNECDLLPCKNNGRCVNTFGSFRCECINGNFNGLLCEARVAAVTRTEPIGTKEFIYIGSTVFGLIIIAIIIVLVCRCYHKRRRKAKAIRLDHERHELKMKETDNEMPPYPPPPPPRRGDVDDSPTRLGSRAPSWDYADLPPEMSTMKMKKFANSDDFVNYDTGEYSGSNGVPQVPRRPRQMNETQGIPDVPKKPTQYRCSRASSQSSVRSQSYEGVSEIGEEGLAIIRQGTEDIKKLFTTAADVVDDLLGTRCASKTYDSDTQSECSQVDTQEPFTGHLETYDDNEVAYFIPDNDMRDSLSNSEHDDETSSMLEKLPTVTDSRGEVLHKESQL